MLAKKNRLPIQQFEGRAAISRAHRLFILKEAKTSLLFSRFGVVISRKVSPKSSERNRLRREIFNWIRQRHLEAHPGRDILLILLPEAGRAGKDDLAVALKKAFL